MVLESLKIPSQKRMANIFFREHPSFWFRKYQSSDSSEVLSLEKEWEEKSLHPTWGVDYRVTDWFIKNSSNVEGYLIGEGDNLFGYSFTQMQNKSLVFPNIKARRNVKGIYQALISMVCKSGKEKGISLLATDLIDNINIV